MCVVSRCVIRIQTQSRSVLVSLCALCACASLCKQNQAPITLCACASLCKQNQAPGRSLRRTCVLVPRCVNRIKPQSRSVLVPLCALRACAPLCNQNQAPITFCAVTLCSKDKPPQRLLQQQSRQLSQKSYSLRKPRSSVYRMSAMPSHFGLAPASAKLRNTSVLSCRSRIVARDR